MNNKGKAFLKEMKEKLANMSDEEFNIMFDAVCDDEDTSMTINEFLSQYDKPEIITNTTYSWLGKSNATKEEVRKFANNLLEAIGEPLPAISKPKTMNGLPFQVMTTDYAERDIWRSDYRILHQSWTDWRLPTVDEMRMIYEVDNNLEPGIYWTSDDGSDKISKKAFNFIDGSVGSYITVARFRVRVVRDRDQK